MLVSVVIPCYNSEHTIAKVFAALSDLFEWMGDETVCTEEYFAWLVMTRDTLGRN